MRAIAAAAVKSSFSVFAEDAAYSDPAGEISVNISLISRRPDDTVDALGSSVHSRTAVFEAMVDELPAPVKGGKVTYMDTVYVIQGPPVYKDDLRLVWLLNTFPEE